MSKHYSNLYKDFISSPTWSEKYKLPLRPKHNNPHIYTAYFLMLTLLKKENTISQYERDELKEAWKEYMESCKVAKGLYHRYPGGVGGRTSHDEIMGIAFCAWYFGLMNIAEDILIYLVKNDGVYNNVKDRFVSTIMRESRFDVLRIPYLEPFLKICSGYNLSIRSEIFVALHIIARLIKNDSGAGGDLRLLLLHTVTSRYDYVFIKIAFLIYKIVLNLRGKTPKKLAEMYFYEDEPYKNFMPEKWALL